ncbi:hypothetical protein ACF3NS_04330 [Arsenicicoccus cauae]|uniref:Uncharacterized protein n=1 Tax=Arsenicicoccus cauae TaxID=2663847 RepID=A0A6I3IR86_9MICO|nr:hypothetical protein [Arsenicicoccus cauae]MTB71169.1 hypothetical protein [Arsenicicoccus cauae]
MSETTHSFQQLSAGTGWRRTGFAPRLPSAAPWYVVEEVFARLFGVRDTRASHLDPEVGRILRTPVELREAVYQLATLIGFPCAVNAIRLLGEHLRDQEREQEREQE